MLVRKSMGQGAFEPFEYRPQTGLNYTTREEHSIPPGAGRPVRDEPIDYGDICDLKIALETSTSLERFIERV